MQIRGGGERHVDDGGLINLKKSVLIHRDNEGD